VQEYEIPELKTVRDKFGSKLTIITLTADPWTDTDEKLRQYVNDYGITWIVASGKGDTEATNTYK
jgi:cytochrome oxidase Cu insertion factor (SCO1/SenC/PrrC family)